MKRPAIWIVLACALAVAAGTLRAQETREAPKKPKKDKPAPEKKDKALLRGAHAQMAKVCGLTPEQQKRLAELNAERKQALKAFRDEHGDEIKAAQEQLKAAREAKDADAARKAQTELKAIHAKQNEIIKKSQADLMAVLTPEQKVKWDEHTAINGVKARFRAAKLSDEQLEEVRAAYVKLATGSDAGTEKGRRAMLAKLAEHVHKEILTEDQRTDVAVAQITRRFGKIKLTDEQVTKVKAAYVKQMTGVDPTQGRARREAEKKLVEEIRDQILTDDQREALPKPKGREQPKPRAEPKPKAKPKPKSEGSGE